MEWLFGSIKKTPKPEVYISNVVEGDFNVVTSQEPVRPPYPLYPNIPAQIYPGQPYSSTSRTSTVYPQQYPNYNQQQPYVQPQSSIASSSSPKPVNPLDSIPFKITSFDPKATPVNEYQLKSIKSQLDSASRRINSDFYTYNFELERSVLSELNCR